MPKPPTDKVTIDFDIEAAQELASTIRTLVRKIDWTLDNSPLRVAEKAKLDVRAALLTRTATLIEDKLNSRALKIQEDKVVIIKTGRK
jgi:hypothetical protein